jgi:hypothetical protein
LSKRTRRWISLPRNQWLRKIKNLNKKIAPPLVKIEPATFLEARVAFNELSKVWKSTDFKRKNKIRIFNTMVKPVLFYAAETWRPTGTNLKKMQTFVNSCPRRILKI